MLTRREWLKWAAAGAAGGFTGCAGVAADPCRSGPIQQIANCYAPKGWALWHGTERVQASHPEAYGPALSITKSLAGLAVTKAVAAGKMSLDEPLHATFPEWRSDPAKMQITLRMLLQQTSGLEGGANALYGSVSDKGRVALALRAVDAPGTQFRYGPSHWEVLGEFLRRKLGGESVGNYVHRSVLKPIGLSSPEWRTDGRGAFYLSTGAKMRVEDLGKLGRTLASLLRGNSVNGFNAGTFADVIRPSVANPMFGGGLWQNRQAGNGARSIEVEDALDPARSPGFWAGACLSPRHPANVVLLVGSSGQRVAIWPSQNRVFARLGSSRAWQDGPLWNALA
jgi:CubicO group peptidase (beta-lactamase class C family)